MLIHHDAALGILTNNAAKCFLSATDTKANVLLSYRRSIIQSASLNLALSAILFVLILLHYSCVRPRKF